MRQLVAFPRLGNYFNPIRKLIVNTTHLKVIEVPKITKKTISLGSKNSPDTVCVPFKYNLGNFIEALDKGATVLFQAGGGCRYRYYAEVQEAILKDLGYNFTMYQIKEKDQLRFSELYNTMLKLNPYLSRKKLIKEIISTFIYIYYLDKIDIYIRKRIGFEKDKNSFKKIKDKFINKADKENSIIKRDDTSKRTITEKDWKQMSPEQRAAYLRSITDEMLKDVPEDQKDADGNITRNGVHFDLRQKNILFWNNDNLEQFQRNLVARIGEVVGFYT